MTLRTPACCLFLTLGLFGCAYSASVQQPPSIASIVAALNEQEAASGPSLDIACVWSGVKPPQAGSGRSKIRYVRTPHVLFMEAKQEHYDSSGGWKLSETMRCVFDRSTGEYREIGTSSSGSVLGAKRSTSGYLMRFASDPIPDVLFKSLLTPPLIEAIGAGKASKQQETIDGAKCWRIDMPYGAVDSNQGSGLSWSVWLDPKIGFCPRQIATNFWSNGTVSSKVTEVFTGYKSFKGGVWLPMRQTLYFDEGRTSGTKIEVKTVSVGKQVPDAELSVIFPKGTRVFELPRGKWSVAP